MQSLYYIRRGKLEWRDIAEPEISAPEQAVVEPLVAGRCDLDYFIALGVTPLTPPSPIGHELVGRITAVGSGVRNFRVGDRVVVPFHISCGHCRNCRKELPAFCNSVSHGATYGISDFGDFGGSLSDALLIPFADAMLHRVPDAVSAVDAVACSDNLTDGWRTVAPYVDANEVKQILVVGGSSVGLYALMAAKALGQDAHYIDADPGRLRIAESLGAKILNVDDPNLRRRYALTVDSSASQAGLTKALLAVEPGGICTSTGIYFGDVSIPFWELYNTDVTLKIGRAEVGVYIPEILAHIEGGTLKPADVITESIDWKDAASRYKQKAVKMIVVKEAV